MKIKVFDEMHEKDLEKSINDFLSEIGDNFIDIKYQVSISMFGDEQIYCFSASYESFRNGDLSYRTLYWYRQPRYRYSDALGQYHYGHPRRSCLCGRACHEKLYAPRLPSKRGKAHLT